MKSIFTPGCHALLSLALAAIISSDFSSDALTNDEVETLTIVGMHDLEQGVIAKNKEMLQRATRGLPSKLDAIELENTAKTYKSYVKLEYAVVRRTRPFEGIVGYAGSKGKSVSFGRIAAGSMFASEDTGNRLEVTDKIKQILSQNSYFNF